MYLQEQNLNLQNTEFIIIKILFWIYHQWYQRVLIFRIFVILCFKRQEIIITYVSDKKNMHYTNKNHSYDQTRKTISNLGIKK